MEVGEGGEGGGGGGRAEGRLDEYRGKRRGTR